MVQWVVAMFAMGVFMRILRLFQPWQTDGFTSHDELLVCKTCENLLAAHGLGYSIECASPPSITMRVPCGCPHRD